MLRRVVGLVGLGRLVISYWRVVGLVGRVGLVGLEGAVRASTSEFLMEVKKMMYNITQYDICMMGDIFFFNFCFVFFF